MANTTIHSVGIDIGTTTTQVIFSRLELVNRAAVSQVPHYEFVSRDITYVSPVVFTPVDFEGRIRENELLAFIQEQYRLAGHTTQEIESGAVIITGETSKARNAKPAIMDLTARLGDFVVATAGPYLESIIAGHGSGASELSKKFAGRVLNIDIGGGTANYALFENGRVVGAACLNVGGRLVETAPDGRPTRLHAPGRRIAREVCGIEDPTSLSTLNLRAITRRMADLLYEVTVGKLSPLAMKLLMTKPLTDCGTLRAVTISGGVGECLYHPEGDLFRFGDVGPMLAEAIREHPGFTAMPLAEPRQTVRATVIGAGAYTLSLSGSTIWLKDMALPMRNIPVVHPHVDPTAGMGLGQVCSGWEKQLLHMDLDPEHDLYALALPDNLEIRYAVIEQCVSELKEFATRHVNPNPLLVIAGQDMGKVLGMLLQPLLQLRSLAVIDEVITNDGDYVDIGKSLFGGEVVPITVKSLVFPS